MSSRYNRHRRRRKRRILWKKVFALLLFLVCFVSLIVMLIRAGIRSALDESKEDLQSSLVEEEVTKKIQETEWENVETGESEESEENVQSAIEITVPAPDFFEGYKVASTDNTKAIYDEEAVNSTYAVLVDMQTGEIVAQKNAGDVISPASMTKILTVLVAAEQIEDLDEEYTITTDITDFTYQNDCSVVGFEVGERVPVKDLFYGTILPSGADAALALANVAAGSHDQFVALMNTKVKELGLSSTAHFTNCIGIYHSDLHCTVKDMAMILKAAMENDVAREVLATKKHTTDATSAHPEGLELSNWFLRRIEDKDTGGMVVGAKTGFVAQSGNCAASYFVSDSGKSYICVTGNAHSAWRCIYDHVNIYSTYTS